MRVRLFLSFALLALIGTSGCGKRIWAQTSPVQPAGSGRLALEKHGVPTGLGASSGAPRSQPSAGGGVDAVRLEGIQRNLLPKVDPGAVWKDTSGKVIQAHGGGITRSGAYWYWFGEDRSQDLPKQEKAVHVYRSRDLTTWEDRGRALRMTEPAEYRQRFGADWQLERPKVFKAHVTRPDQFRYVMYMHLDAAYRAAEVGVAGSNEIEGPYTLLKHFRPLGQESRDIGQFVDDDGSNYLIFESRPTGGFFVARLSPDALSVEGKTAFLPAPLEGGAIVHTGGMYYCVASHMSGWKPNPNVYATARSLAGPWSTFKNIAPAERNTYGGQSAMLLKVEGTKGRSAVIFLGDIWKPDELWDSRYLWMPLKMADGKMELPPPEPWRIDVRTATVLPGR